MLKKIRKRIDKKHKTKEQIEKFVIDNQINLLGLDSLKIVILKNKKKGQNFDEPNQYYSV